MKRVTIDLKNCYGIKSLKKEFDFTSARVYAIYAPNGVMKSSLAQTFQDAATKQKSADRIFPQRESTRRITDETGKEIEGENRILVVLPYNDGIGPTERTSTLLIAPKLKDEYIQLHIKTRTAKQAFLGAIAKQAYSPKIDFEREISSAITRSDSRFGDAMIRIKVEIDNQKDTPFANVIYDRIFNEKVLTALETKNLNNAIEEYIVNITNF